MGMYTVRLTVEASLAAKSLPEAEDRAQILADELACVSVPGIKFQNAIEGASVDWCSLW